MGQPSYELLRRQQPVVVL